MSNSKSPPSSPTLNIIQKRRKKNVDNEDMRSCTDRLSKLPDDILVYLCNFMDMKTAARTSLLSKRWRYVWTHITNLDFNKNSPSDSLSCGPFCKWVNNATTAHRAPILNFLRIYFPLPRTHKNKEKLKWMEFQLWLFVHKWVKFGLKKKVAKLELNMATASVRPDWSVRLYMIRPNLSHFRTNWKSPHLKSLHLEGLCIDGPLVEKVLFNCLNLEQLTVKSCAFKSYNLAPAAAAGFSALSSSFRSLDFKTSMNFNITKIIVSSLKLKHLEFDGCNIDTLQISAQKLTSFVLIPSSTATTMPTVEYTSVPSLVDVTFVPSYCFKIFRTYFSPYTLEKLSLRWNELCDLEIGFPQSCDHSILVLISLIEACPLLHTFKLELQWRLKTTKQEAEIYVEKGIGHKHLKVIEIVGYDGSESVDRLTLCLVHPINSPKLDKIILDPMVGCVREKANMLAKHIRGDVQVAIL